MDEHDFREAAPLNDLCVLYCKLTGAEDDSTLHMEDGVTVSELQQ